VLPNRQHDRTGRSCAEGTNKEKEMKKLAGKRLAVIASGLSVVLIAGVAFAAWTASGTGSGTAKALSAQTVTVQASTGTADLYPGSTGAVYFTLNNTNPYSITFDKVTAASVTSSSDEVACPNANLSINPSLPVTGLTLAVGANTTSAPEHVADLVKLAHTAPDGCQGKSFTISLTLTGSQD
jgi:hypothetical protein